MMQLSPKLNKFFSRLRTSLVVFSHDMVMIPIAWLGAYWLRFNLGEFPPNVFHHALTELPLVVIIQLTLNWSFGLYRGVWRFASMPDLIRIFKSVTVAVLSSLMLLFFYNRLHMTPRSVFPLYGILLMMLLGGPRFIFRWFKDYAGLLQGKRVLIVGSGQAGESLVRDLLRYEKGIYSPLMFVDDDPQKKGKEIHGVRVVGNTRLIPDLVIKHNIDLVVIAMPSAKAAAMRRIVSYCENADVPCSTLPSISDLADGRVSVEALRKVSLEDLLGRDPVTLDWAGIKQSIAGQSVLVTGGAGSIGSELCRQIAQFSPSELIVADHSEYNLYQLQLEFADKFPKVNFTGLLIDVTDRIAIATLFSQHQFAMVFHAAAYKHVPMLETQLRAALYNNVVGTLNVAQLATQHHVGKFILISTDKAVHPANIMGASKRAAEIFCQNFPSKTTQFITVRFGNVLGSAGSVVPLFRKQIQEGGPVTVTHPDISRYFMTIPEATQLILQASLIGQGGEIFVLDMGEPMKISDLAEQMIHFAGLKAGEDIEIKYIGLRPGEKLTEELFHHQEKLGKTSHEKIHLAKYRKCRWNELELLLTTIQQSCYSNDLVRLESALYQLVPEYLKQVELLQPA